MPRVEHFHKIKREKVGMKMVYTCTRMVECEVTLKM